eukprot:GGOE01053325.1.p2 GENE.GGOE01053325.1~~GGOE01053325.1.p2  ORF type:complete len:341 (-),score=90.89 GGOE01053325.1:488-1510(-)
MRVDPGDGDWALRGKYFGWQDICFSILWALALLMVRPVFLRRFYRPLALYMKMVDPTQSPTDQQEEEIKKFCKYCWHGTLYVCFLAWGLYLYVPLPWAFDVDQIWASYPHAPEGKLPFKYLFLMEAGFYIHGFVEGVMHDARRSDFVMIMVHHVVATALIFGCVWGNAHRVGISVIVEQDIADIVIYLGKGLHQCARLTWVQSRAFHTFFLFVVAVTWFSTRVIALGMLVHAAWSYGLDVVPSLDSHAFFNCGALLPGHAKFDGFSMCLGVMLTLLLLMQIVWFIGILWMFLSQLFQGTFHDFFLDPEGRKAKSQDNGASAPQRRTTSPRRPGGAAKKIE